MSEQRLEGLVLASRPLGENDRLLSLLTLEQGLVRLAAPGARPQAAARIGSSARSLGRAATTRTSMPRAGAVLMKSARASSTSWLT